MFHVFWVRSIIRMLKYVYVWVLILFRTNYSDWIYCVPFYVFFFYTFVFLLVFPLTCFLLSQQILLLYATFRETSHPSFCLTFVSFQRCLISIGKAYSWLAIKTVPYRTIAHVVVVVCLISFVCVCVCLCQNNAGKMISI